jgi:hypothetical protein
LQRITASNSMQNQSLLTGNVDGPQYRCCCDMHVRVSKFFENLHDFFRYFYLKECAYFQEAAHIIAIISIVVNVFGLLCLNLLSIIGIITAVLVIHAGKSEQSGYYLPDLIFNVRQFELLLFWHNFDVNIACSYFLQFCRASRWCSP